jgi:hypothetical protein
VRQGIGIATMGLTELERDRERRIAENRRRMEAMLGDMAQYDLLT